MKVPPPQNLIVRAIPTQSIVRHFVLAAAAHVIVLCGAASAQSVPAAPPLILWNAVEVTHGTVPETTVTLERSDSLQLWQPTGMPVYGDGDDVTLLIAAGAELQGFFRLKSETRPAAGHSRWDFAGLRLLVNTNEDARILTFELNGAGIAEFPHEQTSFAWEWLRTGRDTGRLTLTWKGGLVETCEFQFSAPNAGTFISERSRNGLPAGAVAGVFRDEAPASFAAAVPDSPGDANLVLSGTGRPVMVSLTAAGTARISSPAGGREYSATYTVTGETSAAVSLSCADGSTESCSLTFTGPSCGTYEMQSKLNNRLRRAGGGLFTIAPR